MAKAEGQKRRILALYQILLEYSDDQHLVSMETILSKLKEAGVPTGRRSVYNDIAELNDGGISVELQRGTGGGYRLCSRPFGFETSDLKVLADAVASAKFLTEKKSRQLIQKIESMASRYEAEQLQRQIYVMGRVHSENAQSYYNVDSIHQAISVGRKISFQYFHYDHKKQKIYKYHGEPYVATPYALCWNNQFYYMVAWYDRCSELRNFRVDRIENILILEKPAHPAPPDFNSVNYTKQSFSMYGGQEEQVTLEFVEALVDSVLDRFGLGTKMYAADVPGWFRVVVHVQISPPFLAWLFQFGNQVRIISPVRVQDSLQKQAWAIIQENDRK